MRKTFTLLLIFLITLQVAVKAQDRIYWGIPSKNISSAKLDGTDVKQSVALSNQTYDMETDFYKGILYWGDYHSVKKANTDGTNLQTLYTGSNQIGGLALDLINNKLYFSDHGSGNAIIRRCNLDGTGMEVIVTSPNSNGKIYNLTISPTLQKLYWTESTALNTNSIIMRCNLDGTNVESLLTTTNFIPGLTIDEKNQRLYLAYWNDNKVMTTDMTCSTTPTLVFGNSNGTFQMAVSNVDDKLYFAELTTNKIRSCNLDGSSPQDIVSGLSGFPMALSIPTVPPAPTIYANDTYTFELNDFLFASVDENLLTKIKITALTSKGTLYLDANNNNIVDAGEEVVLNQEISKTDIVAGTLKFNPVANDYGSPYTTFNFKWFDGTSYSTLDYLQYIYVLSIAPTVTTQAVSDIGSAAATGNGNITDLGVPFPTSYGVCWNTTGSPTTSNSKVDLGAKSVTGAFTATMTGLTANTTYKARAYATNEAGTSYGTEVSFTTATASPTVTGISPTSGPSAGGTMVTITGTDLTNATAVKFGSTAATSFTVNSATQITATSPAGSAETVHITVTTAGGTSATSSADQFVYLQPQPITFNALETHTYGDAPFTLAATGGASGNPVDFTSSDPTVATCTGTNGATITLLKAGSCTITANQAGNAAYEAATPVSQTLTVNALPVTVTVNANQSKMTGGVEPALTYTVTPALVNGDAFTGALAREAGETVGTYAINQGTLSAGANYTVTFVGNSFSITPPSFTISGNAGIAGATLSYFDGTDKTVVAAADGSYSITVPAYWSGTVAPSMAGYSFSANKEYTNVSANLSGENYTATDIVAPTMQLTYSSDKEAVKAGDIITFTATFSDANGISESPAPTITIGSVVVNAAMNKTSNLVWTYTWTVPANVDETVTVSVTATDPAGNRVTGGLDIRSYVIDNTPPAATVTNITGESTVHVLDNAVIGFSEEVVLVEPDLANAIIFREGGKNGVDLPFTVSSSKDKSSRANVMGLKTAATGITQIVAKVALKCNTSYYLALKAGTFADMAGNLLPLYETTFNTDPNPAKPVIAGTKASLCSGDVLTCSNGSNLLTYTWQKDGKDIAGASGTTYTMPDNAAGAYSLKVTDTATSCTNVSDAVAIAEYPSVTPVVHEKKQPGIISILVVDNTSNAFTSYQWTYADGSALPSGIAASNQFLVLNAENMNTAYKVTATDIYGCKRLSEAKSVTVASASIVVYPTVSSQRFTVNYADAENGNAVIRVVNSRGEIIQKLQVAKNSLVETYDLNLGYVPAGVYYIELQMGAFKDTKRVIINK